MLEELRAIEYRMEFATECQCRRAPAECIEVELARPLSRGEKMLGWETRPLYALNADALCCTCRAYWHVVMACQALERHETLKMVEERGKVQIN